MIGPYSNMEAAAIMAHEANRAYCELLGDESQVPWQNASQNQKDSALAGVTSIWERPSSTPEESHEGWLAHKEADGWVYGEVKDEDARTHPCMVDYEDLPESQRLKDSLFGAVVRAVLRLP